VSSVTRPLSISRRGTTIVHVVHILLSAARVAHSVCKGFEHVDTLFDVAAGVCDRRRETGEQMKKPTEVSRASSIRVRGRSLPPFHLYSLLCVHIRRDWRSPTENRAVESMIAKI
jgi:hypothetical protein